MVNMPSFSSMNKELNVLDILVPNKYIGKISLKLRMEFYSIVKFFQKAQRLFFLCLKVFMFPIKQLINRTIVLKQVIYLDYFYITHLTANLELNPRITDRAFQEERCCV